MYKNANTSNQKSVDKAIDEFTGTTGYTMSLGSVTSIQLMSSTEKSYDATVIIPSYSFTYYGSITDHTLSPVTNSIDHWGYYNNVGNTSLFPTTGSDGTCIGTANRQPNETFTKK